MLSYKDLRVNFKRPFIWKKQKENNKEIFRSYADLQKEEKEFVSYKGNVRKEVVDVIDKNLEASPTMPILSLRMADMFDHFSKSLIFDNDIDPVHLLKHSNKVTLNKKLQPWCKQLNANVPYIIEQGYGIVGLLNKFPQVPAFVCAAGPSLKNNMSELRKVGNKGIIIATDTAFRPLLEAGIVPHFVMAHDANHNGAKFFLPRNYFPDTTLNDLNDKGLEMACAALKNDKQNILKDWNYKTVAIFVNYVSPLTIQSFCGDTICFYSVWDDSLPVYMTMARATNWKLEKEGQYALHDKGAILGGSSVGHTTCYLANALGCNPISFLGLDLSYPEGKTYVDGASNQKDLDKIKLVDVKDLSGREVKTNVSMFSYKSVFEKMLPQLIVGRNLTLYNCTEHPDGNPAGILEEGAEPRRLSSVIDEYCKEEIPNIEKIKEMIQKDREGQVKKNNE